MNLESFRADFQPQNELSETAFRFRLNDELKVETKHRNTAKTVSTALVGRNWRIGYNFISRMFYGQYENQSENFRFKVTQTATRFNSIALHSPELQLGMGFFKKENYSDNLELSYDLSRGLASFEQTFTFLKKYELVLTADRDSLEALVTLNAKVGKPYAKIVSAKYSDLRGPILSCEAVPSDKISMKLETVPCRKTIKGEFVHNIAKKSDARFGFRFQKSFSFVTPSTIGFFLQWSFDVKSRTTT